MQANTYDLVVIGGGSAGMRAARLYAAAGKKVALVEQEKIGGTCVNVGCIPKKLFAKAAHFAHDLALAQQYGWDFSTPQFDWPTLVTNTQTAIKRLHQIYTDTLTAHGVLLISATACYLNDTDIQITSADGARQTITAAKYIIATGGKPLLPRFTGAEHLITSNDFFSLERLPRSVAVLGGGYIALELASLLQQLGVVVTLIHRSDVLLRGFARDITKHVEAQMRKQGIRFITNATVDKIVKNTDNSLTINITNKAIDDVSSSAYQVECALAAIGRVPNISDLALGKAGIKLNVKGGIEVDEQFQTSNPRTYALGDVIVGSHADHLTLTPIAIAQAKCLIGNWLTGNNILMNYATTPSAIFVQPTAASVGFSEENAKKTYASVRTLETQFAPLPETLFPAEQRYRNWLKLVIDGRNDRVLGVHMIGDGAEDIIQVAAVCVKNHLTYRQLSSTLAVHPSVAEELILL